MSRPTTLQAGYEPRCHFVDGTDKSVNIIREDVTKGFDFIIKREKNKSVSDIKYLTTMLPCTLIDYEISRNEEIINWNKIGKSYPNKDFKYDIFFSGKNTSKSRLDLIESIREKNYKTRVVLFTLRGR